jgi:catechol 2,3-dioxygenase-like lactoylglutathione lyase family enzyme
MDQKADKGTEILAWPKSIFAITLFVEDLEETKQFYKKVFGLPIEYEDNNSCVFKFGDTMVNLLKTTAVDELISPANMANPENGSRNMFTIMVDDVDARCVQLAAHGVKLLNGPMDRPWGIRTASFKDPGGHIWEIAR